jgi:hypothetical protein
MLQLLLVQGTPQHPAQARHALHPVQQRGVFGAVLIAEIIPSRDAPQGLVFFQQRGQLAEVAVQQQNTTKTPINDCILSVLSRQSWEPFYQIHKKSLPVEIRRHIQVFFNDDGEICLLKRK